jgi:hypothetical protein
MKINAIEDNKRNILHQLVDALFLITSIVKIPKDIPLIIKLKLKKLFIRPKSLKESFSQSKL